MKVTKLYLLLALFHAFTIVTSKANASERSAFTSCKKSNKLTEVKPFSHQASDLQISANEWLSENYETAIGNSIGGYRWVKDKNSAQVYLEHEGLGKDFYSPPIDFATCKAKAYEKIVIFQCTQAALLYNDRRLVAVSVDDYSSPDVKVIESLRRNGKNSFFVQIGVKCGSAWYLIPKKYGDFSPVKCHEKIDCH